MEKTLIIISIFFISGLVFYLFPPKKINNFYGYRTYLSKKNNETWLLANRNSALYLLILSAFNFIPYFIFDDHKNNLFAFFSILIFAELITVIIIVDYQLRKMSN